jgi:glucosylceramidase
VSELSKGQIAIYLSSEKGHRLERQNGKFGQTKTNNIEITVNASTRYQTLLGFGGAFTDSTGINLKSLKPETAKLLIEQYYGDNGIQYTIGRVPIASCDFSTRQYSYCDSPYDFELRNFSLAEDDHKYKIPYIVEAINLTKGQLKLFASPWSPPAWFKTSNRMAGPGSLKGPVNGQYYQVYAKYLVR